MNQCPLTYFPVNQVETLNQLDVNQVFNEILLLSSKLKSTLNLWHVVLLAANNIYRNFNKKIQRYGIYRSICDGMIEDLIKRG